MKRGFTLLEVMLALEIFALPLLADVDVRTKKQLKTSCVDSNYFWLR